MTCLGNRMWQKWCSETFRTRSKAAFPLPLGSCRRLALGKDFLRNQPLGCEKPKPHEEAMHRQPQNQSQVPKCHSASTARHTSEPFFFVWPSQVLRQQQPSCHLPTTAQETPSKNHLAEPNQPTEPWEIMLNRCISHYVFGWFITAEITRTVSNLKEVVSTPGCSPTCLCTTPSSSSEPSPLATCLSLCSSASHGTD